MAAESSYALMARQERERQAALVSEMKSPPVQNTEGDDDQDIQTNSSFTRAEAHFESELDMNDLSRPPRQGHAAEVVPDLTEARRLFDAGFKLCKLKPNSKRPDGDGWNVNPITVFDNKATGYGAMLATNSLCSVDPDRLDESRRIMAAWGFDLNDIMSAGARTASTRPGSGGRAVFRDPGQLTWLTFAFHDLGTVLELRARSANLQDVLPGVVYLDKSGALRTQHYVNGTRVDDRPGLPDTFLAWWYRCSNDVVFLREQQRIASEVLGIKANLAVSSGGGTNVKLAFESPYRINHNQMHQVEEILPRHGYTQHEERWAPHTATGAPSVRLIAGKDDLWQSSHASDPLFGTFDAWTAFVVLDHKGDLKSAEAAFRSELDQAVTEELAEDDDFVETVNPDTDDTPLEASGEAVVLSAERIDALTAAGVAEAAAPAPDAALKTQPVEGPLDGVNGRFDHTEAGNANLLYRLTQGDLRYVAENKIWLYWTGKRWERDTTQALATAQAKRVGTYYLQKAASLKKQLDKADESLVKALKKQLDTVQAWAKTCRNRRGLENMLALAAKDARFVVDVERLDVNPYLLGVQNGVVDLRTGALRPDGRDEFVTMRCTVEYEPNAAAPRFRRLIAEVTGEPIEVERDENGGVIPETVGRYLPRPQYAWYLQKALGYSISGVTREQKMFTTYGKQGSNGKNQVAEAVLETVGPYGVKARPAILMTNRKSDQDANKATPAFKALDKKRFVVLSEPDAKCVIDNGVFKSMTGDKDLSVRGVYGNEINITVMFHLWMLANVKPPMDHMEPAVVGRLAMLPFDREWNRPGTVSHNPAIPDGEAQLSETLQAEKPGILSFLVEGACAYFSEGLVPCAEVKATTVDYFNEQDPVARWLERYQVCDARSGTSAGDLFREFRDWRTASEGDDGMGGEQGPITETAFGITLKDRSIAKCRGRTSLYGIRLKPEHAVSIPDRQWAALVDQFGDLA